MAQPTPPASHDNTPAPTQHAHAPTEGLMSPPSSGSTTARPIITLTSTVAADDDASPTARAADDADADMGMTGEEAEEASGDEVEEVDTEEEEEEEIEASSEDEVMDAMADPADVEQSFGGVREEKSTILGDEEGEPLADDGRSTGIEGMKAVGGSAAEGGMLASGGTRKKRDRKGKGKARSGHSVAQPALGGASELSIASTGTGAEGVKVKRSKQKSGGGGREGGSGRAERAGKKGQSQNQDVWESDIVQAWNKEFGDVCKAPTAAAPAKA